MLVACNSFSADDSAASLANAVGVMARSGGRGTTFAVTSTGSIKTSVLRTVYFPINTMIGRRVVVLGVVPVANTSADSVAGSKILVLLGGCAAYVRFSFFE